MASDLYSPTLHRKMLQSRYDLFQVSPRWLLQVNLRLVLHSPWNRLHYSLTVAFLVCKLFLQDFARNPLWCAYHAHVVFSIRLQSGALLKRYPILELINRITGVLRSYIGLPRRQFLHIRLVLSLDHGQKLSFLHFQSFVLVLQASLRQGKLWLTEVSLERLNLLSFRSCDTWQCCRAVPWLHCSDWCLRYRNISIQLIKEVASEVL